MTFCVTNLGVESCSVLGVFVVVGIQEATATYNCDALVPSEERYY